MPPALKKQSRARLLFRVVLHDKAPQISKHCGFDRAMIRGALGARVLLIAEQGGWRIVHIHLLAFAEHANLVNVFRVFGDPVDAFDMRTGANGGIFMALSRRAGPRRRPLLTPYAVPLARASPATRLPAYGEASMLLRVDVDRRGALSADVHAKQAGKTI